ncbi:MAG: hypothetical protein ABIV47_23795 [Roseiflexaceae bacterium]
MTLLTPSAANNAIEIGAISAVRSHESFDPLVEAVCHHSGSYLTRSEVNPLRLGWLREQHDFPGFPELDREFTAAAHARKHQHLIWNRPGVLGAALIVCGMALLAVTLIIFFMRDQIGGVLVVVLFYLSLIFGGIIGLTLLLHGFSLFTRRSKLYHRQAAGQPPAISDLPLRCAYAVEARERLRIDLGNTRAETREITAQTCTLTVRLQPEQAMASRYQEYCRIYQGHAVGQYAHAGVLALENRSAVRFDATALEFGHRLPLRVPVPAALAQPNGAVPPIVLSAPYTLRPRALYGDRDERRRAPIECLAELDPNDSYTLLLRFRLRGNLRLAGRLEECRLSIPPELEPVERIVGGRYDVTRRTIIWRNVPFTNQELVLRATFGQPLLRIQPLLSGTYQCIFDGLISGMIIGQDRIWNALGRRASEQTTPQIVQSSAIDGDLAIDVRRLAQEHEYVCDERQTYDLPPDDELVCQILEAFQMNEVDVLRIDQAAPRLDPDGTLDAQLWFWDITGRRYEPASLDALDVHVVVSGIARRDPADVRLAHAQVDLRVRCLHDPRNPNAPQRADNLLGALNAFLSASLSNRMPSP